MQELIFCELKTPGGNSTQWTRNSYDKVNPTSLFRYDVQSLFGDKKSVTGKVLLLYDVSEPL